MGPFRGPVPTVWFPIAADSVGLQLWYIVDAGSRLRFKLTGDSLRGQITSSGHMAGPWRGEARVIVDSVVGRRIGDADPARCVL